MIGVAQEKMRVVQGAQAIRARARRSPSTSRASRSAVNHYYFYVHDRDWGPAFLKIGTYLPYPVKLCLNGHEWVKQQLRRQRVRFESLDNGFLAVPTPRRCRPPATRSGRPTCRPSSIAGRTGCPGR